MCMYVCMYVCVRTLTSKALYDCFHVRDDALELVAFLLGQLGALPKICMYVCTYVCCMYYSNILYRWTCECIYVCMYVCMH